MRDDAPVSPSIRAQCVSEALCVSFTCTYRARHIYRRRASQHTVTGCSFCFVIIVHDTVVDHNSGSFYIHAVIACYTTP